MRASNKALFKKPEFAWKLPVGSGGVTGEMYSVRERMLCAACSCPITRLDIVARRCNCCGRALEDRHYVGWARLNDMGDVGYCAFVGCESPLHLEFVGGDRAMTQVGMDVPSTQRIAEAVRYAVASNIRTNLPTWWAAHVYANWMHSAAVRHCIVIPSRAVDCEQIFHVAHDAGIFWKKYIHLEMHGVRVTDPKRRKFVTPSRRTYTRKHYTGVVVDVFNWSKIAGKLWPQKPAHEQCVEFRREAVYNNDHF